jgi:Na+-transporting NADH:ubiquinone oxidoreductase subunit C
MFLVTVFFSTILISFSRYTRDLVEANRKLAFEKAVLKALSIPLPVTASNMDWHNTYLEKIKEPQEDLQGVYIYKSDDMVIGYALPFEGQGFWAPIRGVIGIATDKRTITGIAMYEQNETPGLGAEITKPEFRAQFEGKQIALQGNPLEIKQVTEELDQHSVHAITGATQTSIRFEKILNDALEKWKTEFLHGDNRQ